MKTIRYKNILALLLAVVLMASMPMTALANTGAPPDKEITEVNSGDSSSEEPDDSDADSEEPDDSDSDSEEPDDSDSDSEEPDDSDSDSEEPDDSNSGSNQDSGSENNDATDPQEPEVTDGDIEPKTPSLTLTASSNQLAPGGVTQLTATVENGNDGGIEFYCNGIYMGYDKLVDGVARWSFTANSIGEYVIKATGHRVSDTITIVCGDPALADDEDESDELYLVLGTGTGAIAGEPITLTATVMQNGQVSTALDGGAIEFFIQLKSMGKVTIANGMATIQHVIPGDPGISYTFVAKAIPQDGYEGDTPRPASVIETAISREESGDAVLLDGATMALTTDPATVSFGGEVTVQAVISDAEGNALTALPGKISYTIDGGAQKTAAYGEPVQLVAAKMGEQKVTAFYTQDLTAEATVTAEFAGDDTYVYSLEPSVVEVGEEFTMTIRRTHPTDVDVAQRANVALKDSNGKNAFGGKAAGNATNTDGLYSFTFTAEAVGSYPAVFNPAKVDGYFEGGFSNGLYTLRVVEARDDASYSLSYSEGLSGLSAGDEFTVMAVLDSPAGYSPKGNYTYVYGGQARTAPYGEEVTFAAQKTEETLTVYCAGDEEIRAAEVTDTLSFERTYPGFELHFDPDPFDPANEFKVGDKLTVWAEMTEPVDYDKSRITGEMVFHLGDPEDEYTRRLSYGETATFTLMHPGHHMFEFLFKDDVYLENWQTSPAMWYSYAFPLTVSEASEDVAEGPIKPKFNLRLSIDPTQPLKAGDTFDAWVELVSPEGIEAELVAGFSFNFFNDDDQYVAKASYGDIAHFTVTEAMVANQAAGGKPFIRAHYGHSNKDYGTWSDTITPVLEATVEEEVPAEPAFKLNVDASIPVRPGDEIEVWMELLNTGLTDAEISDLLGVGFDYNLNDTSLRADNLLYGVKHTFTIPEDIKPNNDGYIWVRSYYGETNKDFSGKIIEAYLPFTTVAEGETEFALIAPESVFYGEIFEADIALVYPADWTETLTGSVSYNLGGGEEYNVSGHAVGTPASINANRVPDTYPMIFHYAEGTDGVVSSFYGNLNTIEIKRAPVAVSDPVITGNATDGYTITANVTKALEDTFEGVLLPTGTASLTIDMFTVESQTIGEDGLVTFTYEGALADDTVIVIEYNGDDYYDRGSSSEGRNEIAASVMLETSATSVYYEDTVVLTATIDPALGSGTGVFYNAYGNEMSAPQTVENGTATYTFAPYPGIPSNLDASYGAYTFGFTPAEGEEIVSDAVRIDVKRIPVEILLTSARNTDGTVTLTATMNVLVDDDTSETGPSGRVYFNGDNGYMGDAQLTGDKDARTATFLWNNPPTEDELFGVNARYNTVGFYRYETAVTYLTLGEGIDSPITLAISETDAYIGEQVTLTATSTDDLPLSGGTWGFYDRNGYKLSGTPTVNGNVATLAFYPSAGTQRYTFRYTPAEAGAATIRSNGVMVEVNKLPTEITLSATQGVGTSTLTATVASELTLSANDLAYLTGQVRFYRDEDVLLGTANINPTTKIATFVWTGAPIGSHELRAVYVGNDYFYMNEVYGTVKILSAANSGGDSTTGNGSSNGESSGTSGGTKSVVSYVSTPTTNTGSSTGSSRSRSGGTVTVSIADYATPLAGATEVRRLDAMAQLVETYDSSAIADYESLGYLPIRPILDTNDYFTFEFNMAEMHAFASVYPDGYYNIETEDFVADVPFNLYTGFPGLAQYLTGKNASLDSSRLRVTIAKDSMDAVQGALDAEGTGATFVSDTWNIFFTVADAAGNVYDYAPEATLEKSVSFCLYTGVADAFAAIYDAVTGALDLVEVAGNARMNVEKNAMTYGIVTMDGVG